MIYLLVWCPPNITSNKLVQYLNGKSSRVLQGQFPELQKKYWGSIYEQDDIWVQQKKSTEKHQRRDMRTLDLQEILSLDNNQLSVRLPYIEKNIIIYGTGITAEFLVRACRSQQIEPIVCDTYKVGQQFMGIEVKAFEKVVQQYPTSNVVIASLNYYEEIKEHISKFINEQKIYKALVEDLFPQVYFQWEKFKDLLVSYEEEILNIYSSLADDKSREIMGNYIRGHYTGNQEFFLKDYAENQYFDKELIKLSEEEVIIDGGAYIGDTLSDFIALTDNKYKHYYAFEPTKEIVEKLKYVKEATLNNDSRITIYNNLLSDTNKKMKFNVVYENMASNKISESDDGESIEAVKIDEVINEEVSLIKMDIEGSELAALKGAEQTILKNKPKLAICIYHKFDDILTIPSYIMSLGLEYKYYIRHHAKNANEYVFYAI